MLVGADEGVEDVMPAVAGVAGESRTLPDGLDEMSGWYLDGSYDVAWRGGYWP